MAVGGTVYPSFNLSIKGHLITYGFSTIPSIRSFLGKIQKNHSFYKHSFYKRSSLVYCTSDLYAKPQYVDI